MKICSCCLLLLAITAIFEVKASNEILDLLNTANDLTLQEVNALRPLFDELQKQYDAITVALAQESSSDMLPWQKEATSEPAMEEYVSLIEKMLARPSVAKSPTPSYDAKLPTLEKLIADKPLKTDGMTAEQGAEMEDMKQIMQEALDEAQTGIDELVKRALIIKSEMVKLNKPKIVTYIYNALSMLFHYSAQLRRAAYCVYSQVPQLNESLQNLNAGVECYAYTNRLINTVEQEVVHTIDTIKKNAFDLAKVYKKIAAKQTIAGKFVTAVLNISKIMGDVREILAVSTKAIDGIENQLPSAALKSMHCVNDFARTLPFILETTVNVTTCITYVEPKTLEYEFLLPESKRHLN